MRGEGEREANTKCEDEEVGRKKSCEGRGREKRVVERKKRGKRESGRMRKRQAK